MDFTGERYVPTEGGQIRFEHLHRYNICLEYVVDKEVLDIASGEGYGSALLATKAKKVTGVDIDPNSINHAAHSYSSMPNLTFKVGSCEEIPLVDGCVDVVVSFETIEHHDKHIEMLNEIKRVLRPNGLLIISSPNRAVYSTAHNYSNPYHVKELDFQELDVLLKTYFSNITYYGQEAMGASFVFEYKQPFNNFRTYFDSPNDLKDKPKETKEPTYFLAFCSNRVFQYSQPSIYINVENDLFTAIKYQEGYVRVGLEEEIKRCREQIIVYEEQSTKLRQIIVEKQEENEVLKINNQVMQENYSNRLIQLQDHIETITRDLNANYSSLHALQNTTTVRFFTKLDSLLRKLKWKH